MQLLFFDCKYNYEIGFLERLNSIITNEIEDCNFFHDVISERSCIHKT